MTLLLHDFPAADPSAPQIQQADRDDFTSSEARLTTIAENYAELHFKEIGGANPARAELARHTRCQARRRLRAVLPDAGWTNSTGSSSV